MNQFNFPQYSFSSLKMPIIVAPMFLINNPNMVVECVKSGIIGTFPLLNARNSTILEDWFRKINNDLYQYQKQNKLSSLPPYGVNIIVSGSNTRFEADLELIKKYKPPLVITSLGNPQIVIEIVHKYGGQVFSDVTNLKHAKKSASLGVDGLILVCNGAGGHAGTYNPFGFINSVQQFFDKTIVLAGSISHGKDIYAAQVLGAHYAYMGTRFIASLESNAPNDYKNLILDSSIENIIYTDKFTKVNANFIDISVEQSKLLENPKAWKDVFSAGHGVGTIDTIQSISCIVDNLCDEYSNVKM